MALVRPSFDDEILPENDQKKKLKVDTSAGSLDCKRSNYLKWDEYFMAIALLSAQRSKDPSTQVGACIVNKEKKIVGIGYNGMPNGCSDDVVPWGKTASNKLDTKYPYVVHAELNAILNKNTADVKDCSIYVALFPCNECAKVIIQSGIREVIFFSDKYHHREEMVASRKLFSWAGVMCRQIEVQQQKIEINFDDLFHQFERKSAPGKEEKRDESHSLP